MITVGTSVWVSTTSGSWVPAPTGDGLAAAGFGLAAAMIDSFNVTGAWAKTVASAKESSAPDASRRVFATGFVERGQRTTGTVSTDRTTGRLLAVRFTSSGATINITFRYEPSLRVNAPDPSTVKPAG
jgi:hypothetical protein